MGLQKLIYSHGLTLLAPSDDPSDDPSADPSADPSTPSDETFLEKNAMLISGGVAGVIIIGLFVLLSKSTLYEPITSTKTQEFSKKRASEKKSRRDRKMKK
ncbi:MAG: hypothetical protein KAR35_04355 [Candidatus Heimdallarchaeota archaeon]|nr:hypothetical protein [Candidatus Heimdallarchaeota archaeon]MCK5048587.1 hypothetical protein [Candidatus Heimdallarchaeota archaeon]